eukprot:COSAG02_NODE_971_length_15551_cov_4.415157_9_plen_77_part_00
MMFIIDTVIRVIGGNTAVEYSRIVASASSALWFLCRLLITVCFGARAAAGIPGTVRYRYHLAANIPCCSPTMTARR